MTRETKYICPKCGSDLNRGTLWNTNTKRKRSYPCKNEDCDFIQVIEEEKKGGDKDEQI